MWKLAISKDLTTDDEHVNKNNEIDTPQQTVFDYLIPDRAANDLQQPIEPPNADNRVHDRGGRYNLRANVQIPQRLGQVVSHNILY